MMPAPKPHHLASSVNDNMHTGPPLQPLLWGIVIRARMSPYLLLGDIEKAFLEIILTEEDEMLFGSCSMAKGNIFDSQGYHLELKIVLSCEPLYCNATIIANRRNSARLQGA